MSRIITSHSAQACDGQPLRLHCPRHSTISIETAFYGSGEGKLCRADPDPPLGAHNQSCSAFTALQKMLSECQSQRDCHLPVNHLLFGKDPALALPNTSMWTTTEHKRHVVCEGETMILRCKRPKVLIVYAAVFGRKCLNHEAVHSVSTSCYSKHKCAVVVSNQTFRDPCFPETRNSTQTLLREADPDIFSSTSSPVDTEQEHPEMAALLFTSSVCVGLILTLLAVSVRDAERAERIERREMIIQEIRMNAYLNGSSC
ncbi:hypothetical protein F7725_006617 [Dissostichus mawsoni]|uniref:SUEL-type lectin domain-containing protein n=1 Tax=Dissostichus mawsoni TaxID=36200 RepID=A0A7J5XUE9_DISMA|nr:hypothetical protein F7725_006617 [Dissostichus mawsoni]